MTQLEPTATTSTREQRWTPAGGTRALDARSHPALAPLCARLASVDMSPFEIELQDGNTYYVPSRLTLADRSDEPRFKLVVQNSRGLTALRALDELQLGIAFLHGDIDVEGDFLSCLDLRAVFTDRHPLQSLQRFLVPLLRGQRRGDMAWVPKHYDFGNDFYFAFLDKRYGLYSQALYLSNDETLERAVTNKLEYIVDICRLAPGSHVLDVGGGWGAFEKFVAPKGIHSTMLTISHEQFRFLSDWCARHGMPGRLDVVYESIFAYRPREQYDAIVLLGVMEHLPDYPELFAQFERLLKPGGRVYMDFAAGRQKFSVSTFTHRFVFPGNHTPVYLPGLFRAAAASEFEAIALHNDRHSYYLTLQAWARNLEEAREFVVPAVGDEVYRLFRLYLWAGAHQLQRDGSLESYRVVFQRARGRRSSEIGCYSRI